MTELLAVRFNTLPNTSPELHGLNWPFQGANAAVERLEASAEKYLTSEEIILYLPNRGYFMEKLLRIAKTFATKGLGKDLSQYKIKEKDRYE